MHPAAQWIVWTLGCIIIGGPLLLIAVMIVLFVLVGAGIIGPHVDMNLIVIGCAVASGAIGVRWAVVNNRY